jgi:uncharacterized membrane protein YeaQ/YmgE (transglycosylase-associated protein family)
MYIETFLTLLLIGAIVGYLASNTVENDRVGILGNMFVGIVGALIVGAIAPPFGRFPGADTLGQVISATIGAYAPVAVIGIVRRRA